MVDSFELVELDLANLKSVRACADGLLANGEPFDVVIANAGVMATPFGHTADGFETQFGTNHLGHFVLVNRDCPLIRDGGRLINLLLPGIASPMWTSTIPISSARPMILSLPMAGPRQRTSSSRLHSTSGTAERGVRAAAVHPGGIKTELGRYVDPAGWRKYDRQMNQQLAAQGKGPFQWKSIPQGAATSVWAAVVAPADEDRWRNTARIATSAHRAGRRAHHSASAKAYADMRSIRTMPRRSGRKAKNWSESLFSFSDRRTGEEKRNERTDEPRWPLYVAGHFADCEPDGLWGHATRRTGWRQVVWGPPRDIAGAIAVLREAVASGVNHIDTSDFYGPHVTNQIIKQALHPYPDDLVIVTKVGARRGADGSWLHARSRQEIIDAVHDNLRNLGLDALDVVNLRLGGFSRSGRRAIRRTTLRAR